MLSGDGGPACTRVRTSLTFHPLPCLLSALSLSLSFDPLPLIHLTDAQPKDALKLLDVCGSSITTLSPLAEEATTVVLWGRTCECADLMTLLRVDVLVYVACVAVCVCVRARVSTFHPSPLTVSFVVVQLQITMPFLEGV